MSFAPGLVNNPAGFTMQQNNLQRAVPRSLPVLIQARIDDALFAESPSNFVAERGTAVLSPASNSIWIFNAFIDTLFVCGGLLAPVLFLSTKSNYFLAWTIPQFLLIVAMIISESHNAATILRFVEEPGLVAKHRLVSTILPMLMLVVLVTALANVAFLSYAIKLYLILITQHVTAQAYGITLMYLRKTKIALEQPLIRALKLSFTMMMIAGMVRQLSASATFEALGLTIPKLMVLPDYVAAFFSVLAVAATVYALVILRRAAQQSSVAVHPGAVIILLATLSILTLSGTFNFLVMFAPAFFHGTQYLAVTTARAIGRRQAASNHNDQSIVRGLFTEANIQYWLKLACLGVFLYALLPFTISLLGIPQVSCIAAMFCVLNFQHFAADAVIWRGKKQEV